MARYYTNVRIFVMWIPVEKVKYSKFPQVFRMIWQKCLTEAQCKTRFKNAAKYFSFSCTWCFKIQILDIRYLLIDNIFYLYVSQSKYWLRLTGSIQHVNLKKNMQRRPRQVNNFKKYSVRCLIFYDTYNK